MGLSEVALLLERKVTCRVPVEYADFLLLVGPADERTGSIGPPPKPFLGSLDRLVLTC